MRGRQRRDRGFVRRLRETGRGSSDEGLHVDADRERSDGRQVSREGGGVGAEVHRAVRPRQDEPRDLHEIVVLGRAPESGACGRALNHEVRRELFRRERLHEGEERTPEEACLLAGEDGRSLAARERCQPRVGVGGGGSRPKRGQDRARSLCDRFELGPVRKEGGDVRRTRREAAREGWDPGNVRERNRRHRSLSTRVFAVAFTARRIRRGDLRRSNGEPSKFP